MRKAILIITYILSLLPLLLSAQSICGSWIGTLELPSGKLRIVLHLSEQAGSWTATLDSPDQGAKGIPVPEVSVLGDSLLFGAPQMSGLKYHGRYDGERITGQFEQLNSLTKQSMQVPLVFERGSVPALHRPQEPRPPYPYRTQEVQIENSHAGLKLAGTLNIPSIGVGKKTERYPAILLVSGSGPQNRDEEIAGHKPFWLLADQLTRAGFAVLRYDDRGVGKSSGQFVGATTFDFASDASAAITYLRHHQDIDPKQIAILGHSEGGLIAQIIAAYDKGIACIAMLGAPTMQGDSLLLLQATALAQEQGIPPLTIEKNMQMIRKVYALARDLSIDSATLIGQTKETMIAYLSEQKVPQAMHAELMQPMLSQMADPWARTFMSINPADYLRDIHCPIIAFYGDRDLQVPAAANIATLEALLPAHTGLIIHRLPRLNHLFQTAKTGLPSEYSEIEETIAPTLLNLLIEELRKTMHLSQVKRMDPDNIGKRRQP